MSIRETNINSIIFTTQNSESAFCLSPEEEQLLEIILNFLVDSVDISFIGIEKRSANYTSLVYGGLNDFLRFKYSSKSHWISLRLPALIRNDNINNPLFAAQKDKRQLHWKQCHLLKPSLR